MSTKSEKCFRNGRGNLKQRRKCIIASEGMDAPGRSCLYMDSVLHVGLHSVRAVYRKPYWPHACQHSTHLRIFALSPLLTLSLILSATNRGLVWRCPL